MVQPEPAVWRRPIVGVMGSGDATAGELLLAERYGTPRIACLAAGETIGGEGLGDLAGRLEGTDDVGRVEAYRTTVLPPGRPD